MSPRLATGRGNPADQLQPPATGTFGFLIQSPQPEYPKVAEIVEGIGMVKQIVPEAKNVWVGRWSELSVSECELLGEVIGRWGYDLCLLRLAKTLPEDPYVIIPLGKLTSSDPEAAPR